jgi:hypothetical protein
MGIFEPFVIETGSKRDGPPVITALFWIARTDVPWRDCLRISASEAQSI